MTRRAAGDNIGTRRCGGIGRHKGLKIPRKRVRVRSPPPAPRRSKLRSTASTGTAERLCLLTFVPLRLFLLSTPKPEASGLLFWGFKVRFAPTFFFACGKIVIRSGFQNRACGAAELCVRCWRYGRTAGRRGKILRPLNALPDGRRLHSRRSLTRKKPI